MAAKPHDGSCGPCVLCMTQSVRYTHPDKMDQTVLEFISSLEGGMDPAACICHACYKQAGRNVGNSNYHPRWRPNLKQREHCGVDQCPNNVYRQTSITSATQIEDILKEKLSFTHQTTPLCQAHYNKIHSYLHAPVECDSCNARPKKGEQYSRHCPNPDRINTYINNISNEPLALNDSSRICNSCYIFFNRTLKRLQHTKSHIVDTEPEEHPIDIDPVLSTLSAKITSFKSQEIINKIEFFELVLCYLGQHIATTMATNQVLLLPDLYRKFKDALSSESNSYPQLLVITDEFPSTRWFISRLNHYFGDSIVFECRHRHTGTLVFHKNCDLIMALSSVLGQKRIAEKKAQCPLEIQITNVTSHFHRKLSEQAKKFISDYKSPEKFTNIEISELIQHSDQELLKFISQLTSSKEIKRKLFVSQEEKAISPKLIRQFYTLCVLLFNTNNACSGPLHVLLTEAIFCNGGNTELVKILNRVGAVACTDTCNRLATQVVKQRIKEGIKGSVNQGVFSIASVDNIDILQPFATVSALDATRSWHGTSIQVMQPFPLTGTLTEEEVTRPPSACSEFAHLDLNDSPIPVQRFKRRRRTLTEKPSPHTVMVSSSDILLPDMDDINYDHSNKMPCISDFHVTPTETKVFKKLEKEIFLAMLLKYFVPEFEGTLHLPALPSLVHCIQKQSSESECSKVAYVDILSEKADSKATLLKVIGNLHRVFIEELNQKWVIVVGDAKIFDVLQELSIEYGENLRWLVPIPGDWHILYNYQKVLIKPYGDAGLMSLAKVSGYRAETLKSLMSASNFRRTHLFLLQCFEAFYEFFLGMFFSSGSISELEEERVKLIAHDLLCQFQELSREECSLDDFRVNAALTNYHSFMKH